jgi:translation initiation factor 1
MSGGNRIPTDGGAPLRQNPFGGLAPAESGKRIPASAEATAGGPATGKLQSEDRGQKSDAGDAAQTQNAKLNTQNPASRAAAESIRSPVSEIPNAKNRGRVDIIRQTAGRGGKTVTVVSGFVGIGQPEKVQLAKQMQQACGAGGTVKEGRIEIQGDKREQVTRILAEAGFRPVFAGG